MKIKFHDIDQNTSHWLKMKLGVASASNFACIMANYPNALGNPAHEYAMKLALERVTGNILDNLVTDAMLHGIEFEPIARERYEQDTFSEVSKGGFFCSDIVGASPDGLIGDDGLIEIKCPQWKTHFKVIKSGKMNTAYRWQVQGQMYITGRKWCDWVSYNEDFPEHKQLIVYRVAASQSDFENLEIRLYQFEKLVQSYVDLLSPNTLLEVTDTI